MKYKTANAFAAASGRQSTQVRESRSKWRPAWRRARALRQARPSTVVGQTCLRSRDQVSRVKHRIKRSRIFWVRLKPQASAAATAITPRPLAEPPAAAVGAAEVAVSPAPAPAEAPLAAPPQHALTVAAPAPPPAPLTTPATVHEETKGAGKTSARRRFTHLLPPLAITPPEGASVHRSVRKPLLSPPCYQPLSLSRPLDWGSPMLAFITR